MSVIQSDPQLLRAWSRNCGFIWTQTRSGSNVLQKLRQDPKNTIMEIARGTEGEYNADPETANSAQIIIDFSSEDSEATYSGYLPIPEAVGELNGVSEENLRILFRNGITGVLRFDDKAELWAKVFHAAWQDPELLNGIRKDPLANLPKVEGLNLEELQNSKYGILPVPDMPSAMSDDTIEKIASIGFEMDNLGGIIPLASCC